jgi:hypothetical protein
MDVYYRGGSNPQTQPGARIIFPEGFDARWEAELPDKGHIEDVVVELECGMRYALNFIDPALEKRKQSLSGE